MRFFLPEPLSSAPLYPLFYFRFAPEQTQGMLFKDNLPENFFAAKAEYADVPENCDAIVLPNNFTTLDDKARAYIARYADIGEKHHAPVYIFACGDLSSDLRFDPRVRVFRYSLYKSRMSAMDICAPTLTGDIGAQGVVLREKSELPTVSFCGKAGFSSVREALASWLRRISLEIAGVYNPTIRARIRGVFWRIGAINACKRSSLIKTLFIIRKNFSGAMRTIELDPAKAREDFIGSIKNSDFVLSPKGDGNYSNRFLEALSMGRIPVLIDTDTVLPLEDKIDYSKIMVRVPISRVKDTPKYIRAFYDELTHEGWTSRQRLARETYEKYLRQDAFFRKYFAKS